MNNKQQLVEDLGLHFERVFSLPNLAARIYALLLLSDRSGVTFNDIKTFTAASKSSISTNLNLLQQSKRVEYLTKPGDRKRYFKPSTQFISLRIEESLQKLESESCLIDQIIAFNQEEKVNGFDAVLPKLSVYQTHLEAIKEKHQESLKKLEQISSV
ncbi:MAG: GbsR/MarR family transcriptional regulator [Bacteroidota bacterium]